MNSSAPPTYPDPPWHTHGFAVLVPWWTPRSARRAPEGWTTRGGLGWLGYVSYEPPSPLVYRELLYIPGAIDAPRSSPGGRTRGAFVQKMLVDLPASLEAGRSLWALPKTLARFEPRASGVSVRSEDGAHIDLRWGARALPLGRGRASIKTLQPNAEGPLVFRGDFRGRRALVRVDVRSAGLDGTWRGLLEGRPAGPLGVRLDEFEATMRPPRHA